MALVNNAGVMQLQVNRSERSCITAIRRSARVVDSVIVVSPRPSTERTLPAEGYFNLLRSIGEDLPRLRRLELHFYMANSILCPARALALLLRSTYGRNITYLLLNGMRIDGTREDMDDLGEAFAEHPSLDRLCLFNIESIRPHQASLKHILKGLSRAPALGNLAIRYCDWSHQALDELLGRVRHPETGVVTVRTDSHMVHLMLTGKNTFKNNGLKLMTEGLKTNTTLRKLACNQCLPKNGAGKLIAEMLQVNTHLQFLLFEFQSFQDAFPVAQVLTQDLSQETYCPLPYGDQDRQLALSTRSDQLFKPTKITNGPLTNPARNKTLKILELKFYGDDQRRMYFVHAMQHRVINRLAIPPRNTPEDLASMKRVYGLAVRTNENLRGVNMQMIRDRVTHTDDVMEFYLRINRIGRRKVLTRGPAPVVAVTATTANQGTRGITEAMVAAMQAAEQAAEANENEGDANANNDRDIRNNSNQESQAFGSNNPANANYRPELNWGNSSGVRNHEDDEWLDFIIEHKEDLSVLFYFVLRQPELVQLRGGYEEQAAVPAPRRRSRGRAAAATARSGRRTAVATSRARRTAASATRSGRPTAASTTRSTSRSSRVLVVAAAVTKPRRGQVVVSTTRSGRRFAASTTTRSRRANVEEKPLAVAQPRKRGRSAASTVTPRRNTRRCVRG